MTMTDFLFASMCVYIVFGIVYVFLNKDVLIKIIKEEKNKDKNA